MNMPNPIKLDDKACKAERKLYRLKYEHQIPDLFDEEPLKSNNYRNRVTKYNGHINGVQARIDYQEGSPAFLRCRNEKDLKKAYNLVERLLVLDPPREDIIQAASRRK